jgi:4-hydroxybenzoate polyprenyltransferase
MPTLAAVRTAAADIKLAHSVFALPFAVLAAFLARPDAMSWRTFAGVLALVVLCMVCARTWAMMVNRLADRRIDAQNARTARRAIASGRLSVRDARLVTAGAAAAFVVSCALFGVLHANWWPLILSVPVLGWIALYSFTKRFTALCHVFLGSALAISPLAAAIAVDPHALRTTPALWLLSGMVLLWVAGFDVIYALQDVAFDRSAGLFSIPSRLGPRRAIWISRALHAAAFGLLVGAWRAEPRFGPVFGAAVAAVALLLIAEHAVLAKRGEAGLDMAFFTLNGVVSCVLGAAGVIALLL